MKRVGVITMHRVFNYGSVLQAYATQKVIERLGYECEIIDYVYPNEYHTNTYSPISLKTRISRFLGLKKQWRKYNGLKDFRKRYLNLSKKYPTRDSILKNPPVYDIYMTGSDQVWNAKYMNGDDVFFLSFAPQNARKVAFACSFANACLPTKYHSAYKKMLEDYDSLSVREENGKRILADLIGRKAQVVLDPTLMLAANDWRMLTTKSHNPYKGKKYILLYMLTYAVDPRPYIYELLEWLHAKTGYSVYTFSDIPAERNLVDVYNVGNVSPVAFLQLFEAASYVITSSFHGTAFAVNFGIPLYAIVPNLLGGDDRQSTLLRNIGLSQCLLNIGDDYKTVIPNYDINEEQDKLAILRMISTDYLKNSLC